MAGYWFSLILVLGFLIRGLHASAGDADPAYRSCVERCEKTGTIGDVFIPHCKFLSSDAAFNNTWYMQEPLYLQWKQLNCRSDCSYHCMMQREKEREALGLLPVKYHGKWPFKRIYVFQEPASAALSALNLLTHFIGWLSFFVLVNYKLPLRPHSKRTYYEYTGLWHIYGLLSMNAWLWSAIFHTRKAGLLICCCITWVFIDLVFATNLRCEGRGNSGDVCSPNSSFRDDSHLVPQLLRARLWMEHEGLCGDGRRSTARMGDLGRHEAPSSTSPPMGRRVMWRARHASGDLRFPSLWRLRRRPRAMARVHHSPHLSVVELRQVGRQASDRFAREESQVRATSITRTLISLFNSSSRI
ncbi:hypothetical protein HPP92_005992 [Vanilla planifolia]|uniref:Post-GPI attachment to proteins factor 3 n=1 Tax=Vanilla planifolia TaxID=51239 RepID=A0A835RQQ4_VANPL|nr:hypothetical protein HPP92_005992 [Vanilla planifolia]